MRPEEAIALVFAMAIMWAGTILVLLSGLGRPERRARRQERTAERAAQRLHRVTPARRLAHRRRRFRRDRSRIR